MGHAAIFVRCGRRKIKSGMEVVVARIRWTVAVAMFGLSTLVAAQTAPLTIVDDPLPRLDAGVEVHIVLHARGGVPPYRWSVAGELPEGISLTREGVLVGRPAKPGMIGFTVTVEDSASPANRISKELQAVITASLEFEWLHSPTVHGGRVDGAVQLTNGTKDDFDLTFIVVAVAENGRATVLGYQHFTLKAGTADFPIPFTQTLAHGAYRIHADAVAEIAPKNQILRRQLETPAPLPVTQGP
jgi:hypothetical protein